MLESLLGTQLLFWSGKSVPTPPPIDVVEALSSVEITQDEDLGSGFQIKFVLSADTLGDFAAVSSTSLACFNRVWLAVVLGVSMEMLIDGIITHHQLTPDPSGHGATLTVTGRDVSVMLDLEERVAKYENQPDFLIATQLLAGYAQYGLVPVVTPTADIPLVLQRTPWQTETDLRFIRRMARRNGYVFYIEPVTLGVNNAYFGPPARAAMPLSALTVGMGADANVKSLHFRLDSLAPRTHESRVLEPMSKATIPIPSPPSLKLPPFALSPVPAKRKTLGHEAHLSPAAALGASLGEVDGAPDAVDAQGEVDTERYGAVIRPRRSIGVRGVGSSYGGQYWVKRVTHKLDRAGNYTQAFTLAREGTEALLPVVLP